MIFPLFVIEGGAPCSRLIISLQQSKNRTHNQTLVPNAVFGHHSREDFNKSNNIRACDKRKINYRPSD